MRKIEKEEAISLKEMKPTIKELRLIALMRDYKAIRERSFGKSIPPVECVSFMFLPKNVLSKIQGEDAEAFCGLIPDEKNLVSATIGIDEDSTIEQARYKLLHEMAHLKVNKKFRRDMGHGKHFKSECRRLMKKGELDDWF